jgi:hypothetical protein
MFYVEIHLAVSINSFACFFTLINYENYFFSMHFYFDLLIQYI